MLSTLNEDRLEFDGERWRLHRASTDVAFLQLLTAGPNPRRHRLVEVAATRNNNTFHAFIASDFPVPRVLQHLGVPARPETSPMPEVQLELSSFLQRATIVTFDAIPAQLDELLGPAWPAIDVVRLVFELTYFKERPDPLRLAKHFGLAAPPNRRPLAMAHFSRVLYDHLARGHDFAELLARGRPRPPEAQFASEPPHQPGVYIMTGSTGEPLYVGKSKDLKQRVGSYIGRPIAESRNLYHLLQLTQSIEVIPVQDELEALLLETSLISRWMPAFNTQRSVHQRGSFIRLSTQEPFPKLSLCQPADQRRLNVLRPLSQPNRGGAHAGPAD